MRDIKIINAVQQLMPRILANGPWIHHATIFSGNHEYILFRQATTNKLYLEKVIPGPTFALAIIEDANEFDELHRFCIAAGLMDISKDFKVDNELLNKK